MLPSERRSERLLALVWCGALALNYPLISLFSDVTIVFGIPALYLYLFLIWCGFIFFTALVLLPGDDDVEDYGNKPQG
jgi:hypothetical protein